MHAVQVLLLLIKDRNGSNFSSFSVENFPGGEVVKIGQPPCHKSKRSAQIWDGGNKTDLLFKDRKPGEHSIQETMEALFRLNGVNVSNKSSDIKAVRCSNLCAHARRAIHEGLLISSACLEFTSFTCRSCLELSLCCD
jgi:hypothetical protein